MNQGKITHTKQLLSPKADVRDQARLRPHTTVQRYSYDGKIVSLLLNLKSIGKADLTAKFIEQGFDYVCDIDTVKLFRKRK
jgi:hypothetical protein